MRANRLQVNQPHLLIKCVSEQKELSLAPKLEDQEIGQVALLPLPNGGVPRDRFHRRIDIGSDVVVKFLYCLAKRRVCWTL